MDARPVLFCYDDSPEAKHAIDAASSLLGDRRAVVLDIAPPVTAAESYATVTSIPVDFGELNRQDALSRAEIGADLACLAGFDAKARADVAAPTWDGVVEVAAELDAAVIVIGSRGLTGARELFEGSFSHEVAEHAGRPVLIVPPAR
jgi:nucleotide-binding universal stress UspA family protein